MNGINLTELAQGAIEEQFQLNFQSVIDNIYDPNTSHKVKRKLVITLSFEPDDEDREMVKLSAKTDTKLAGMKAVETKLVLDHDLRSKKTTASEWGRQMKGQLSIDDVDGIDNVVGFDKAADKK